MTNKDTDVEKKIVLRFPDLSSETGLVLPVLFRHQGVPKNGFWTTAPVWLQSREPEWPVKEPLRFQTHIKLTDFVHGHPSQRLFGASDGCPSEQG
jgi:hypothetical protein